VVLLKAEAETRQAQRDTPSLDREEPLIKRRHEIGELVVLGNEIAVQAIEMRFVLIAHQTDCIYGCHSVGAGSDCASLQPTGGLPSAGPGSQVASPLAQLTGASPPARPSSRNSSTLRPHRAASTPAERYWAPRRARARQSQRWIPGTGRSCWHPPPSSRSARRSSARTTSRAHATCRSVCVHGDVRADVRGDEMCVVGPHFGAPDRR
jgi:hypothetical protein